MSTKKRSSLLRTLPKLLATYCHQHRQAGDALLPNSQDATETVRSHSEPKETKDGFEEGTHMTAYVADATIPPSNTQLSLEGFFIWLDAQTFAGSYAGTIKHDIPSQIEFLREFLSMPIGSGNMGKSLQRVMCANHTPDSACERAGGHTICQNCLLVRYCSPACLTAHYKTHHESICTSLVLDMHNVSFPLCEQLKMTMAAFELKTNIGDIAEIPNPALPVYGLLDDLNPSAFATSVDKASTSSSRYPTSDECPLSPCNPFALPDHLHLFFPALYNLRNIFQTVCNIPDDYTGTVSVFLNFTQAKIAVRDFLILELLRYYGLAGIDLAIAIWNSTAVTATQDTHLLLTISRMLHTWRDTLPLTGEHSVATYKESFPSSRKGSFLQADFGMDVWSELTALACNDAGDRVGFNPERQYIKRWKKDDALKISACLPMHLACWQEYGRLGLALPFSSSNSSFNIPNRLRYDAELDRISRYENDPLTGWDLKELTLVASRRRMIPTHDLYGCVFFYLREMMEMFLLKTTKCCVRLRLMLFRPRKLIQVLQNSGMKFHRIDACALDIDDEVSPDETMQLCGGLLAHNVAQAWPSLLLTATLKEWLVGDVYGEELMDAIYKEGIQSRERLAATAHDAQSSYMRTFWHAVDPITATLYMWNFAHKDSGFPSLAENVGKELKEAAARVGLHKQRQHRIVSPTPALALKESQKPLDQLLLSSVNGEAHPYYKMLFSGFTFQERFHEWGWASCN